MDEVVAVQTRTGDVRARSGTLEVIYAPWFFCSSVLIQISGDQRETSSGRAVVCPRLSPSPPPSPPPTIMAKYVDVLRILEACRGPAPTEPERKLKAPNEDVAVEAFMDVLRWLVDHPSTIPPRGRRPKINNYVKSRALPAAVQCPVVTMEELIEGLGISVYVLLFFLLSLVSGGITKISTAVAGLVMGPGGVYYVVACCKALTNRAYCPSPRKTPTPRSNSGQRALTSESPTSRS